jgi:hypothetical protein
MRQDWNSYEKAAERGPFALAVKVMFGIAVLGALGSVIGGVGGWFSEAATVAHKELGPNALLNKYQWFKDAAAQLDKKRADIGVYDKRVEAMKADYGDQPRAKWDRTDKEQMSIWMSERAGVIASYNGLCAEYNSAMAKINWRFANRGDVPHGSEALPREYREYIEQ